MSKIMLKNFIIVARLLFLINAVNGTLCTANVFSESLFFYTIASDKIHCGAAPPGVKELK